MAQNPDHLALHIIRADFHDIGREWNSQDVRSSFWRFYINNRDTASIRWREGTYRLTSGHLHLIPAYVRFSCQNTGVLQHLYVHFDVIGLPPLTQEQVFTRPFSSPLSAACRRVLTYCSESDIATRSFARDCLIQAALFDAMSRQLGALAKVQRERLDKSAEGSGPIGAGMQLLEARLPGPIRVAEMAEACAMSEDHFGRVFKATVGQTPGRYILQRRIALAARELLYGDVGIDVVSQRHGFANRFHFTRVFSRIMGATPAAYRKSNRV